MEDFGNPRFVERIRAGEPEALRMVVETYLSHILNAARAGGLSPDKAEDVAQATFQTFIERASSFEGRSHVRTWLFGILYRKVAESRRKLQRDRQSDDIDAVVEGRFHPDGTWQAPPQVVELYGNEVGVMIKECMEHLSPPQRMAFVLREVEELSTAEMCKILDVSRTNLGVLLFRARNRLRECLETRDVGVRSEKR